MRVYTVLTDSSETVTDTEDFEALAAYQVRRTPFGDKLLLKLVTAGEEGVWTNWHTVDTATKIAGTDTINVNAPMVRKSFDNGQTDFLADTVLRSADMRMQAFRDRNTAIYALENFKDKAREVAIQGHLDGDYCITGLNDALETLGLNPYVPSHQVTITVSVTAMVEADTEDEARDLLYSAVSVDDSGDDGEITDVDISHSRY